MKKLEFFVVILILFMFSFSIVTYASEKLPKTIIDSQMNNLDFSQIDKAIQSSSDSAVKDISIKELMTKAIQGELDLSPLSILKKIADSFVGEITALLSLIRNMVLIAIFSALLNNLSASLNRKDVSELGFYISYLMMILILLSSFNICIGVMQNLADSLCTIMQSALPTMTVLMVFSGDINSAYVFNPIFLMIVNVLSAFIKDYVVPITIFAAILQLINYISEKEILEKLSDLIKNSISWLLKGVAVVFITILSLQSVSAPIVDNIITKSARATINVVPVVGQALSGAVDTVMYWSGAVRSGAMVAIIIIIILACAVPIIKLITFIFIFKLTAAIIQPISDERIVKAIDSLGSFTTILLSACITLVFMFIFMTLIMLSSR